jgi:[ribosomal protein S18]-alanine N-acetyltransferase
MPVDITIRTIDKRDIDAVCALETESRSVSWSREGITEGIASAQDFALVAVDKLGTYCGYIIARYVCDECEIDALAVHPEFRRNGIARQLIQSIIDRCAKKGGKTVVLDVRSKNIPAIALYTGLGFVPHGKRTAYYGDGDDAVLMTLAI